MSSLFASSPPPARTGQPNILILMPDELRADALGYAGHPVYKTPHIDRLAREGVAFTNAYCTSPLCMPARASMISGLYPHNHQMQDNVGHLPEDDETYLHLLQRAGYRTAAIGKLHFWPDDPGRSFVEHEAYARARGFHEVHEIPGPASLTKTDSYLSRRWRELGLLDRYRQDFERRRHDPVGAWASPLPLEEYADCYVGQRAVEWLSRYDGEAPFCLHVGFGGPHPPFDAPEPYASMYDPATLPAPVMPGEAGDWVPAHARTRALALSGHDVASDGGDGSAVPGGWEHWEHVARARMANYGGKIHLIDAQIGRILNVLDERGLAEHTLVIFLSDHGEMGGDHGRFNKSVFYEGAVRIPLVLRWPGRLPAGQRVEPLVEQLDLFASAVDAAGAPASLRSFSRSLLPLAHLTVHGDPNRPIDHTGATALAAGPRDLVFSELKREVMVRTDRYKYALDAQGRGFLLFDLHDDPHERCNLLGHPSMAKIERELRDQVLTWLVRTQVARTN